MKNIQFGKDNKSVIIIDQTLLPGEERYIELSAPEEMYEAIKKLRVRGAPAIGIFAGYALAALAATGMDLEELEAAGLYLVSARPTAVNLSWAVNRVLASCRSSDIVSSAIREALTIHEEDKSMCRAIAEYGIEEIRRLAGRAGHEKGGSFGVLTHCNAGPLATSEYGTALGPIILGQERGIMLSDGCELKLRVFADETRPLLQGARLTAYELKKAGVDVTLICDNMASAVMNRGWVQACFVGCDRVAANGDTANKIGTSGVAILAKHYDIPFYVLGPSSTIDISCKSGADIPIEERDPSEIVAKFFAKPVAPEGIKCYDPAFDVTDNELISGIITEKGILRPPYDRAIAEIFK